MQCLYFICSVLQRQYSHLKSQKISEEVKDVTKINQNEVVCLAWHPKENMLATISLNSEYVNIWDAESSDLKLKLNTTFKYHKLTGFELDWKKDGKKLAIGTKFEIQIFDY